MESMAKVLVRKMSSLMIRMRKKLRAAEEEEIYTLEGTDTRGVTCFSLFSNGEHWREKALRSPHVGAKEMEGLWEEEKEKKERVYGDGLWRRTIILGEKCRPLDFEGVIHYDEEGRRVLELPRSPMRSPMRGVVVASAISAGDGGKR